MSVSDDRAPRPAPSEPYAGTRRTVRPLLFLIPIALALALCLTLFATGIRFLAAPIGTGAQTIAQDATPVHGPNGTPEDEAGAPAGKPLPPPAQARNEGVPGAPQQARAHAAG